VEHFAWAYGFVAYFVAQNVAPGPLARIAAFGHGQAAGDACHGKNFAGVAYYETW